MKITITEQQYRKLIVLNEQNRTEILKDKFVNSGKLTPEVFDKLIEGDPTNNKVYLQWIINQYVKIKNDKREEELFIEDLYKMNEYLELFDRLKNRFTYKDINQYKNYKDFIDNAINIKNSLSDKDLASGITKDDKTKEYQIGEVNGFKVYKIPKGRNDLYWISCLLGTGTEWCTATNKTNEGFERYIKDGSLYIFIKGKEKYEFHYETDQFQDKDNKDIFGYENYNKELFISFFEFLKSKENIEIPISVKVITGMVYDINEVNIDNIYKILYRLPKNERLPFINKVIGLNKDFINTITADNIGNLLVFLQQNERLSFIDIIIEKNQNFISTLNGDNINKLLFYLEENEKSPFIYKVIKNYNFLKSINNNNINIILYFLKQNKKFGFIYKVIKNNPDFLKTLTGDNINKILYHLHKNEKSKLFNILTKKDDFNQNVDVKMLYLILRYSKRPISLFKRLSKEKRLLIKNKYNIKDLLDNSINKESVTKLLKHYNLN